LSRPEERRPLIQRGVCAECGEPIYEGEFKGPKWFTCGICGKEVCESCAKFHIPRCFALTWGAAKEGPGGEIIQVEKPSQFSLGTRR
jgi:hypothetical protein